MKSKIVVFHNINIDIVFLRNEGHHFQQTRLPTSVWETEVSHYRSLPTSCIQYNEEKYIHIPYKKRKHHPHPHSCWATTFLLPAHWVCLQPNPQTFHLASTLRLSFTVEVRHPLMFSGEEGAMGEIRHLLKCLCVSRKEKLLFSSPQKWEALPWAEHIQLFIQWPYLHLSTGEGVTNLTQSPGHSKDWVFIRTGVWVHKVYYGPELCPDKSGSILKPGRRIILGGSRKAPLCIYF